VKLVTVLPLLKKDEINVIIDSARKLLEEIGVRIWNDEALKTLKQNGANVNFEQKIAKIPAHLIQEAIDKAPKSIPLYTRDGKSNYLMGNNNVFFIPGSAAVRVVDRHTGAARAPTTQDLVEFVRLVEGLDHLKLQSTAIIPMDVPEKLADRYRLYIVLCNSNRPIYTGAFTMDGAIDMKDMLLAVSGDEDNLAKMPRAVFVCCTSPPLKWSDLTSQNLMDLALYDIPISVIPVPMVGLAAPPTLAGALIQHVAEVFSGIVLTQLIKPGCPVFFGGSPAPVHQKSSACLTGSIEAAMLNVAATQVAKTFNLPTDFYAGLTNSNTVDEQSTAESAIGMLLAATAGINMIEGAGMIEFESCQSFEKVVIDNEIAGYIYRYLKGIDVRDETLMLDLLREIGPGGVFTSNIRAMKLALQYFNKEVHEIGPVFNVDGRKMWESKGGKDTVAKAKELVEKLLRSYEPNPPPRDVVNELNKIMDGAAKKYGTSLDKLPWKCEV
jgi:trimethylamine--corrinoid protein Co-methyltransferase